MTIISWYRLFHCPSVAPSKRAVTPNIQAHSLPTAVGLSPHHHFSKCPMSPVTGNLWLCRIVRTLRSAADGASIAAEGDDLLLLLDVLKELDGALQLPAVDGLGSLAGVLEGNTEVGTAGLGRLGGRDLGGSVANLWVELSMSRTQESPRPAVFPLAPSQPSAARRFPNFRQPGVLGQSADSVVLGFENRGALTILTVLMWRWCRRRRWVLMVVYGSGWLGSFLLVKVEPLLPNQTVGSPVKSFCAPANHKRRRCPAWTRAPSCARRGYLGTGPTLASKFFNFFCSSKSSLGRPHQLQLQHSTTPHFTTGIQILPCRSHA